MIKKVCSIKIFYIFAYVKTMTTFFEKFENTTKTLKINYLLTL